MDERDEIVAAIIERAKLYDWLLDKDRWLYRNPTAQKFKQREDQWLAKLAHYESLCDFISTPGGASSWL